MGFNSGFKGLNVMMFDGAKFGIDCALDINLAYPAVYSKLNCRLRKMCLSSDSQGKARV